MQQSEAINRGNTAVKKSDYVIRFSLRQRIEHIILMVVFIVWQ